jgi:cytochrome c oxidase assembly factor CtaG
MLVAHTGHWALSLIYTAPVVILLVFLMIQKLRERRQERREGAGSEARRE